MAPLSVLALNSGSSSLKFGLYRASREDAELICEGESEAVSDTGAALDLVFEALAGQKAPAPEAIGHRIVHGGSAVRDHAAITPAVMERLREAADFAPLHVPAALHLVDECKKRMTTVPQVACLDTAFHRTMPDVARTIALSKAVRDLGVERYGFHGLSLQSIVDRMESMAARTVVAHLGGGCSVTALLNGRSIDTTMGFTPTGGIMMGTRPGDLDPGAVLFLMRRGFASPDKLEHIFDRESGLLGVSETSSDMRELRKRAGSDDRADLALRVFEYQVKKAIAAMAGCLGGLDALIFTGGIGEHDRQLRDDVVTELRFLGGFAVQVLPSQEEAAIARITAGVCAAGHR